MYIYVFHQHQKWQNKSIIFIRAMRAHNIQKAFYTLSSQFKVRHRKKYGHEILAGR
jgi:hypothetical protein